MYISGDILASTGDILGSPGDFLGSHCDYLGCASNCISLTQVATKQSQFDYFFV